LIEFGTLVKFAILRANDLLAVVVEFGHVFLRFEVTDVGSCGEALCRVHSHLFVTASASLVFFIGETFDVRITIGGALRSTSACVSTRLGSRGRRRARGRQAVKFFQFLVVLINALIVRFAFALAIAAKFVAAFWWCVAKLLDKGIAVLCGGRRRWSWARTRFWQAVYLFVIELVAIFLNASVV